MYVLITNLGGAGLRVKEYGTLDEAMEVADQVLQDGEFWTLYETVHEFFASEVTQYREDRLRCAIASARKKLTVEELKLLGILND